MSGSTENTRGPIGLGLIAGVLWLSWQAIRVPVLALLVLLEPVVSTILVALAFLGIFTAFFWKLASTRPDFPFFGVLALSLGCLLVLALYHAAIRLLQGSN